MAALPTFSPDELRRYGRQMLMPELGMKGQARLKEARVVCIGAGGLGSPLLMYLAAAGIGTLGIVEFDTVDGSNLHRQILYGESDEGKSKAQRALARLRDINPHIEIAVHEAALDAGNAVEILSQYDIVADGTDNFPTRYLVNDVCVRLGKPNVHAAIFRFDGQLSVFDARKGPCYRCVFPTPPEPGTVPNCAEAGVLGVLPGIVGSLQAAEVVKLAANIGEPLFGKLLLFDALTMDVKIVRLPKDPECACCGASANLDELEVPAFQCDAAPQVHSETEVTARALEEELRGANPPRLLDVREETERQICVIEPSVHIPLGDLPNRLSELDNEEDWVVYCRVGQRSGFAADLMRDAGFPRVRNLAGGTNAWARDVDPTMPRY